VSIWLDAQLPPSLATWIADELSIPAMPVRDLGLRNARDRDIFLEARIADAVVMTKDADFISLLRELGPPPRVIWLRCGNTSNACLRDLLRSTLLRALALIAAGESLVEIADRQ
jgi:predicted nuclease of predicted toxin-antitoxin system